MEDSEIISLISNKDLFPHFPKALVEHIELLVSSKSDNRLLSVLKDSPQKTAAAINSVFKIASEATNMTADDLLKRSDFNKNDLDPTRIDAAFAEIRGINYLSEQNFTDIQLLKADFLSKKADLVAKRKSVKWVGEVLCSIYEAKGRFTSQQISKWLSSRFNQDKSAQLNKTLEDQQAQKKVIAGIINTKVAVALQTHDDFLAAATMSWKSCGSDPDLHVCLVTGRNAIGYGKDDAVYPPWP